MNINDKILYYKTVMNKKLDEFFNDIKQNLTLLDSLVLFPASNNKDILNLIMK